MIVVDSTTCDRCGACVPVCPVDAILLHANWLEFFDNCIDCLICIQVCPVNCLRLKERTHA